MKICFLLSDWAVHGDLIPHKRPFLFCDVYKSFSNVFVYIERHLKGDEVEVVTNENADDFVVDGMSSKSARHVSFDGTMELKSVYTVPMSEPVALEDGFMSESEEIDFAEYKKIEAVG